MRHELELAVSATMEPQSDICDHLLVVWRFPEGLALAHCSQMNRKCISVPKTDRLNFCSGCVKHRTLSCPVSTTVIKGPIINGSDTLNFSGYLDIEVRTNTTPENQQNATETGYF